MNLAIMTVGCKTCSLLLPEMEEINTTKKLRIRKNKSSCDNCQFAAISPDLKKYMIIKEKGSAREDIEIIVNNLIYKIKKGKIDYNGFHFLNSYYLDPNTTGLTGKKLYFYEQLNLQKQFNSNATGAEKYEFLKNHYPDLTLQQKKLYGIER